MRFLVRIFTGIACVAMLASSEAFAAAPKTIFDYIDDAWAFGEIRLSTPLRYRDGRVLAYGGRITELMAARQGEPRNLTLVYEMREGEEKEFFTDLGPMLAPIGILPKHSYWRDNLPKTPLHEVLGGRRNVFHGEDLEEARRFLAPFASAASDKTSARWPAEILAVAKALAAESTVIRSDAVRYLATHRHLARHFPTEAIAPLAAFFESDADVEQRVTLIEAIGRAQVAPLADEMLRLSERDDAVGAAALSVLGRLDRVPTIEALLERSRNENAAVRASAGRALGERSAEESEALARAVEMLNGDPVADVRQAVVEGLGRSGNDAAVEPLNDELLREKGLSKQAALALAEIGDGAATKRLRQAIVDGPSHASMAAVYALPRVRDCADCNAFLAQQFTSHPDEEVRHLIAITKELEVPHEH